MYRIGKEADAEAIYRLVCELEETVLDKEVFMRIYEKQCHDEHYACLVCEADHKIIAVCNLRFEEQLHHTEKIAEILELSVDENARGNGIGKEMLTIACAMAKQYGCTQIEASSNQRRKKAHRFYEREGMVKSHFKFIKRL